MNNERRYSIIALYKERKQQSEIARILNAQYSTVSDVIKHFHEYGTTEDRPASGRLQTANTPRNQNIIRYRNGPYPQRFMEKIVRNLRMTDHSVKKIVKEEPELRTYKQQSNHLLTQQMKGEWLQKVK